MKKRIITISREYGSGGHAVARLLGEKLGIKVYDKKLVAEVAAQSGFDEEFIEKTGEQASKSSLFFNTSSINGYRFSQSDQLFILQTKIIRSLADEEPCIIVGRCADYVLRERSDCLHAFVHAPVEHRMDMLVKYYGVSEADVKKVIRKTDKERKSFYEYYTEQTWGDAHNFHISLNSGEYGIEGCAEIIGKIYEAEQE